MLSTVIPAVPTRICHLCRGAVLAAGVWLGAWAAAAAAGVPKVQANRALELTFTAAKPHADPFNDLEMDVLFTDPAGARLRVPAFWAGGPTWRVRYASPRTGTHSYRTECSDATDRGLHGVSGTLKVVAYRGDNPLYRHGPIRVAGNRRHFEHADGTPFLWLADTWWMGLCDRLRWPDDFQTLAADRRAKGFNVIQIVAGLYPDMPAFDDRGRNEAGFPWEKDYARINPAYFDAADRRLARLADAGLSPCIVGAWGYHLPWLGVERMKKHWRYLVARYGASPVVWCVAGEAAMPYYLSHTKAQDQAFQRKGWTQVAAYLRRIDSFHRPVTVHPTDSSRTNVDDPSVLDFDMLQTGHGDKGSIPNTVRSVRASRAARPMMPVLVGEVCYEGIVGTCFEDVERFMAWSCLLSGTAGHTYGANGIWQVNRREQPYGASPHGGNWGNTPWDEAMRRPGSRQTGLAKRLLEQYAWERFEPHPEWASVPKKESQPTAWGDWIWFPEGDPTRDAPVGVRYFRHTIEVPPDKSIRRAVLRLTVDDRFTAYLNGTRLGDGRDWKVGREFAAVGRLLRPGKNGLAVRAENAPGPPGHNPAGLACHLEIHFTDGGKTVVSSDGAWRCSQHEARDWQQPNFDDSAWPMAKVVARYGEGPWGRLGPAPYEEFLVPFAAGIPNVVRVIYLPRPDPVTVHDLEPGRRYAASYFNPASGERTEAGTARPDARGTWAAPRPPRAEQEDWVLLLEAH